MLLYIIRHADPIYETDTLTPKGEKQAEVLAERLLAKERFDRVFSSPAGRAQLTAKPTSELLGIDYEIEPWMDEALAWEYFSVPIGDTEHRTWLMFNQTTELKNDNTLYMGADWHKADIFQRTRAKEGYEEIGRRSDDFMLRLGYRREGAVYKIIKPNEERVAVFCHQMFGLSWMSHLLSIPPHVFWASFDLSHSGVCVFEIKNNEDGYTSPKCLMLSDLSHIYADEELPFQYNNEIYL